MSYVLTERLQPEELREKLHNLNKGFSGYKLRHKGGDWYQILGFSVLNHNGIAEYLVDYVNVEHPDIPHRRPVSEFFDGRFVGLSTIKLEEIMYENNGRTT